MTFVWAPRRTPPPCPSRVLAPKGAGSGAWLVEKAFIIIYVYFGVENYSDFPCGGVPEMTLICLFRGPNYADFPCGGVPKRALHGAAIGPMVLLEGTPTSPSRGVYLEPTFIPKE